GGLLDRDVFSWMGKQRNLAAHPEGGQTPSAEQCKALVDAAYPVLQRLFLEIDFVRRYPLGFARAGYAAEDAPGLRHSFVYSGMGIPTARGREALSLETAADFAEGVPFVVAPDGAAVLYLWPFLLQRKSDMTQQPSFYVFEAQAAKSEFLERVRAAAI